MLLCNSRSTFMQLKCSASAPQTDGTSTFTDPPKEWRSDGIRKKRKNDYGHNASSNDFDVGRLDSKGSEHQNGRGECKTQGFEPSVNHEPPVNGAKKRSQQENRDNPVTWTEVNVALGKIAEANGCPLLRPCDLFASIFFRPERVLDFRFGRKQKTRRDHALDGIEPERAVFVGDFGRHIHYGERKVMDVAHSQHHVLNRRREALP